MAKLTLKNVVSSAVRVAMVYWSSERNFAREKDSTKRLPTKQFPLGELAHWLSGGWDPLKPIPTEEIGVASDRESVDYVSKCNTERQAQWDVLRADKSPDGIIRCKVFEDHYVENGKLIAPALIANACFQRGASLLDAMVLAARDSKEWPDSVPVAVNHYSSETERLAEQVRENEHKNLGSEAMSDRDRLRTAKKFYDLGCNQNYLRKRIYTDTTGQKVFYICKLDQLWPNVHILERYLKNAEVDERGNVTNDHIPYGPLGVKDLNDYVKRSSKETCEPGKTLLTESDIVTIFADVRKGKTNSEPIMKRDNIAGLAGQCPNMVIRDTAKAILENNTDIIQRHMSVSVGVNSLLELVSLSAYPPVELVLVNILQGVKAKRKIGEVLTEVASQFQTSGI